MGVTKSTKLAALISIILATTAFLVAATTQPVSYAKITEDQAITIILSNRQRHLTEHRAETSHTQLDKPTEGHGEGKRFKDLCLEDPIQ